MGAITMVAWRRPDYFYEVIESLKGCIGIEKYTIYLSIDGGYPDKQVQMVDIIKESGLNYKVHLCEENVGCAGNTKIALSMGFNEQERVIHIEDDTVLHPQALLWFEHNLDYYEDNKHIFSISGYTNGKMNNECLDGDWTESHVVGLRSWFSCWGWATWKRVWDEVKDDWFGIRWNEGIGQLHEGRQSRGDEFLTFITKDNKGSWGVPMNHYWRGKRFEIAPHTSFIQNIGFEDSTWATNEVHKYKQFTDWFKPDILVIDDWEHFFTDDFLGDVV